MAIDLYLVIGTILIIPAVLGILMLFGMRGRGRLIQCPECGARFKRPTFATKAIGIGPGLPGIGSYACPKCKHRANTSYFRYVDEQSSPSAKQNS
jgi:uncharacterized protein YlaI